MARGKKNLTLDEQLQKITAEIENMETSLKKMKETKTELEEQIHQARLVELDNLISENGLSFDDVKNLLCSKE
jgi:flagellar biosynthesis chaperone FliJ